MKLLALLYCLLLTLIQFTKADSVCTLETLRREISEDLADNKKLDCLMNIKPHQGSPQDEETKNKRILAQWDTSCSFESDNPWFSSLTREFGIKSLVNVAGEPVPYTPNDNEADICQIIRAMISNHLFDIQDLDMRNLRDEDIIYKIDCPGPVGDTKGPKICAASSGSFYNQSLWSIFMTSSAIKISDSPKFEKDSRITKQGSSMKDNFSKLSNKVKEFFNETKDTFNKNGGSLLDKIKKVFKPDEDASAKKLKEAQAKKVLFINRTIKLDVQNTNSEFMYITDSTINLDDVHTNKSIFVFYNFSLKTLNSGLKFKLKTFLNGTEKTEGRLQIGPQFWLNGSGGYAANIYRGVNLNSINLKYSASSSSQTVYNINTDSRSVGGNFNMGVIAFSQSKVYTSILNNVSELKPSVSFTETKAKLELKNDGINEMTYFIFYGASGQMNISAGADSVNIFGIGLSISNDSEEISKESVTFTDSQLGLSNHGCAIIKLKEQESKIATVRYILRQPIPSENENSLSISAIELPKSSTVTSYPIDPLAAAPDANSFTLELKTDRDVMFILHTNLLINDKPKNKSDPFHLFISIVIGQKEYKFSEMMFGGTLFTSGTSYMTKSLREGKYAIKIKIETNIPSFRKSDTYRTGATLRVIQF